MPDAHSHTPGSGIAPQKRTLSVRVRLMILAVIAVVPLFIERVYNEELDRDARIEAAYKQALVAARQGAAAQNEVFVSARTLLQTVANARATFNPSNADCTEFLTTVANPIPWIKSLSVANLQGKIICTSLPLALGLDISERPHFTAVIDNSDFYVSDYFVGPRLKAPIITVSLAQLGFNGAAAAVVVGVLDLSWFERVAKNFMPPSAYMMMVDGSGALLAQYPSHQDMVGQRLNDNPLVTKMLSLPEGFVTEAGPDGVRRIFGFVQLPGTNARIAVGFDEQEVIARVNRAMWLAFAEASVVAILVLLSIWFGGERLLVRPIQALASTASRIGHGDAKTHAADLPWASEFVPLAAALDDMAGKLNEREQELRDTNHQLRELAQVDGLTGLANRRAFNERLWTEWKLACKLGQPIAVLMIDVDFFKKFNDHYGHVQGDGCLRKVADVLMAGTRAQTPAAQADRLASAPRGGAPAMELPPSFHRIAPHTRRPDFAARYGGEEFVVLLQGADLEAALHVGERLCRGVEDLLMAHAGAPWGFVSVSIGAASITPTDQDGPQDLTEAADAALYEAKRQGRNRVVGSVPAPLSQAG